MVGKLPPHILAEKVFTRTGATDPDVVLGPGIGVDAGVVRIAPGKYLVVHTDPITEASSRIGWLAVNVAANDVAVAGARPRWASIAILLPEGGAELLDEITEGIDRAAKRLGISIIGGHTEEAPGVTKPLVVATVAGIAERILDIRRLRSGLRVVVVKPVGLEGTAILASDFADLLRRRGVAEEVLDEARRLIDEVSVVEPALAIADIVAAMHDPTEGGLLGALYEAAVASKKKIVLYADRVLIHPATRIIAERLDIDPLRLISSGSLVAFAEPEKAEEAVERLRALGFEAVVAGVVEEPGDAGPRVEVYRGGRLVETVTGFVVDEIARIWEGLAEPPRQ